MLLNAQTYVALITTPEFQFLDLEFQMFSPAPTRPAEKQPDLEVLYVFFDPLPINLKFLRFF